MHNSFSNPNQMMKPPQTHSNAMNMNSIQNVSPIQPNNTFGVPNRYEPLPMGFQNASKNTYKKDGPFLFEPQTPASPMPRPLGFQGGVNNPPNLTPNSHNLQGPKAN